MIPRTWLPYLQLVRIPNIFTALSNALATHLIATGGNIRWGELLGLMAASALLYSGGMVLNDCFDAEEDRRERPFRPLPSGRVPMTTAWILGGLLLVLGVAAAGAVGERQFRWALILAGLILFYDGHAKRTAFGSVAMGACRYANWGLGLSIAELGAGQWLLPLVVFVYVVSLTLLSRIETYGAVRGPVVLCGIGVVAAAMLAGALVAAGILPHAWPLLFLAVGIALVLRNLGATWREPVPARIQASVKSLVLGIIPLDAVLAAAGGPWWGGVLVLLFLWPSRVLARRIRVT